MEDDDWSFWPAIGSPGALHDLRDDDGPPRPRLMDMTATDYFTEQSRKQIDDRLDEIEALLRQVLERLPARPEREASSDT